MRASTLFAITLSLLLGLGAVAGARYAGLFDKKEPPPPDKPVTIKVLTSATTLYQGIALDEKMVEVKDKVLNQTEEQQYKENQARFMGRFMAASAKGAALRIPKNNIPAGQVLMADMFEDPEIPPGPTDPRRVDPGYRAINVAVKKENSVGGTIRVGEYVDVWLTTRMTVGSGKTAKETVASACIAKECKVVMKRNTIWPLLRADPDNKPINFTVQANPYRAAVIEFADNRGEISLRPVPPPENKGGSYGDLNSKEYADEDERVRLVKNGEYTVGDRDMMRIFGIVVVPAPKPTPPTPPIMTRRIVGNDMMMPALYDPNGGGPLIQVKPPNGGQAPAPASGGGAAGGGLSFSTPSSKKADPDCEFCGPHDQ
jgi:Flp pilus assembly protein CpaB